MILEEPNTLEAEFRRSMRQLAGGVCVITAGRTGMTATSVVSLSMDPPSILVCIKQGSSTWKAIRQKQAFCINLIKASQVKIAENFAGFGGVSGEDRYRDAEWDTLCSGTPVLVGALANVDCELQDEIEIHTHSLFIGAVRAVRIEHQEHPLLYFNGAFTGIEKQFENLGA